MTFLNKDRRIARETETTKYRIRQVEKTDDNIYRITRRVYDPNIFKAFFIHGGGLVLVNHL